MGAVVLPFRAWSFHLSKVYGVSTQSYGMWLALALGKMTAIAVVAGLVLSALYRMAAKYPRTWWRFALVGVVLTSVLVTASGALVAGAAGQFEPLSQGPLRQGIESMLKQEGVTLGGIRVEPVSDRTPVPNAYLSGLGRGAQLVVTDTLLDSFTVEESLFVVGHELSHSLLGHLW